MIRKFCGMMVFVATVLTASFGQHLFGPQDLDRWASNVQEHGPEQARIALKKTDIFLGNLATQAGTGPVRTCTVNYPDGMMSM